mmetsp:Transcript_36231/g.36905  ORF Transcript_36231/g.36905 Transcript_36231/m.36905 type:complete len:320 (-) Transcript_36231:11-970(-)
MVDHVRSKSLSTPRGWSGSLSSFPGVTKRGKRVSLIEKPLFIRKQEEYERKTAVEEALKIAKYKAEHARITQEHSVPLNIEVMNKNNKMKIQFERSAKQKEEERERLWRGRENELKMKNLAVKPVIISSYCASIEERGTEREVRKEMRLCPDRPVGSSSKRGSMSPRTLSLSHTHTHNAHNTTSSKPSINSLISPRNNHYITYTSANNHNNCNKIKNSLTRSCVSLSATNTIATTATTDATTNAATTSTVSLMTEAIPEVSYTISSELQSLTIEAERIKRERERVEQEMYILRKDEKRLLEDMLHYQQQQTQCNIKQEE